VQQQILLAEAKAGIYASDDDVIQFLHQASLANSSTQRTIHRTESYTNFIAQQFNLSVTEFEQEVKQQILIRRCRR